MPAAFPASPATSGVLIPVTYDAETNEVVEELAALLDVEQELTVTEAHLEQLRCRVTDTIEHGDPGAQKRLLHAPSPESRSKAGPP